MITFYDILKISRDASNEEILNAYRKRCIEIHLNKGGNEIDYFNIKKGYEILSNPTKRATYDKWLLQKEKEELEKQILELKLEKDKYNNSFNKEFNKKTPPYFFIIQCIITIFAIGFIFFNLNKKENTVVPKDSKEQVATNSYITKIDIKWLYNELSKHLNCTGTYNEFLQELKDPIMIAYYYREIKRLNLPINTLEDFKKLLLKENIINDTIQIKTQIADKKTLLNTNKFIENTNVSTNNVLSKHYKTNNYIHSNANITYNETTYKTGDSPYANYYKHKKGIKYFDKESLSKLTITNYSSKEAVVLLESANGIVIRNVYIKNNDQYCLTNIPEGYYRIKVMYGNSWNSEKNNGINLPKGGFMQNISFTKSKDNDLFNYSFENTYNGISYPTYSITLHKVKNGNMKVENISKEDYFSN